MVVPTKPFLLSTFAAFVTMFTMSLIGYLFLLGDTIESQFNPQWLREAPGLCCTTLGYLALAVLMSWVYPHYRVGDGPIWQRGLRFGLVMGLLWVFPLSLVLHGLLKWPFSVIVIDTCWALLEQGVGGIVIAAVYQRTKHSPYAVAVER